MANKYNSNRLQFVHCDTLFATRDDAKAYVGGQLISIDRPALYAEPMVLKYGSEENPNILLAIGSVGDGKSQSTNNKVFFIDLAHVNESIEEILDMVEVMGEDIAEVQALIQNVIKACGFGENGEYVADNNEIIKMAKSLAEADHLLAEQILKNTINVKDTSSVDLTFDVQDSGSTLSADVVLAPNKIVDNIVLDNILLSEENGIFANVNVVFDKDTDILTFSVNGKKVEYQLPHEVHLKSGIYNKETEAIELTLNNDEVISVAVSTLIDEWGVLDADAQNSPIVLKKTHVAYDNTTHDYEDFRDILSADVRIASKEEKPYNILKVDETNNRFLYVDGTAQNIVCRDKNGKLSNVQDVLNAIKCEASKHDGNIISVKNDGVFASVDITYNAATNVLHFDNGINNKDIILNSASVIEKIYYDTKTREIVVMCELTNGEKEEVRIGIDDVLVTFEVDNTNKTVTLASKTENAQTYLSADVNISNIKDNILVNDNNSLYVKGTADNIQYDEDNSVAQVIAKLDGSVDINGSIRNLINAEKSERVKGDNDLNARIGSVLDNLKAEETARKDADNELQKNITAEETARKDGEKNLQVLITAEETARVEGDTKLAASIKEEATARETADNALTNKINEIDSNVQTKLEASEKTLTSKIEATATDLTAKINAVDTKVDTLDEKVNTEITNKVTTLETLINTEVDKLSHNIEDVTTELTAQMSELQTTISADLNVAKADLTKAIENETAERKGADEVLTNNITNVIASLEEEKKARQAVEAKVGAEENRAKAAEDANKDAIVVEREARIQGDTNLESSIKTLDTNLKLVQQAYEAKDVVLSSGIEANTKKLDEVEALVNAKANALSTKETNSMITTLENDVLSTDVKISQSQGANILQVLSDGLHANVLVSYDAVTSKLTFDNGIVSESWTVASNSLVKNAYYTQDGRLVLEIENGNGSVEQLEVKIDRIEGGSKADSPITVNVETTDAGTRMITADIAVSNHEHNGLTINGGLFVSNHASDIYGSYKDQYSDLQTILTAIQEDMPPATLEDDVRDLMSDVRGIADDINDLKDDMRGWDDNIKDLNDEIARLNGIVADLQSQIDNLIDFGTCTVVDTTPTPEVSEDEVTEDENNSVE